MRKLVCFTLPFVLSASAHAGVVFEIETKDHEDRPREMSIAVEEPNLAIPVAADPNTGKGKGKMIFRGDRGENGELIVVDDDEKAYYVMDEETMAAMGDRLREAMKQMEQMLQSLPKEQQEAIRKAREQGASMPGMPAMPGQRTRPEVKSTGQSATRHGYPCVKYEVWRDGRKIRELWVTDWSNVEGGGDVADTFAKMGTFFQAMMDSLPQFPGGGGPLGGGAFYDEMPFEHGFPVESTGFDQGGGIADYSALRSARRRALDPAEFEPPAGYKRRSMGPQ